MNASCSSIICDVVACYRQLSDREESLLDPGALSMHPNAAELFQNIQMVVKQSFEKALPSTPFNWEEFQIQVCGEPVVIELEGEREKIDLLKLEINILSKTRSLLHNLEERVKSAISFPKDHSFYQFSIPPIEKLALDITPVEEPSWRNLPKVSWQMPNQQERFNSLMLALETWGFQLTKKNDIFYPDYEFTITYKGQYQIKRKSTPLSPNDARLKRAEIYLRIIYDLKFYIESLGREYLLFHESFASGKRIVYGLKSLQADLYFRIKKACMRTQSAYDELCYHTYYLVNELSGLVNEFGETSPSPYPITSEDLLDLDNPLFDYQQPKEMTTFVVVKA